MTKTVRNTAAAAEESFHKHYAAIWGEERWRTSLFPALAESTRYVALANNYVSPDEAREAIKSSQTAPGGESIQRVIFPELAERGDGPGLVCYAHQTNTSTAKDDGKRANAESFAPPQAAKSSPSPLFTHWNLDGASALVAHMLDARPGHRVLDLCAAPGGKSVALAQKLWPDLHYDRNGPTPPAAAQSRLVSNEVDGRRQKRLTENLKAYLPRQIFEQKLVATTRTDASQSGPGLNELSGLSGSGYDRVLVDAPCSSERHIVHAHTKAKASGNSASEMTNWRPGSSKRLAKTQVDILMTALGLAKVGGVVIYATCSIEPAENDGVLEKMLTLVEKERKKGAKWSVRIGFGEDPDCEQTELQLAEWAERTRYGWIVLPDHAGGGKWGPLFFARLTKLAR